ASLGVAVARSDTEAAEADWLDSRVRTALDNVQQALGVEETEVVAEFMPTAPGDVPPPTLPAPAFSSDAMRVLLDGKHVERREMIRALLQEPDFRYEYDLDKTSQRNAVLGWIQILSARGLGRIAFPDVLGESDDLGEFVASFETLAFFDLSLVVKYGVQFGLFGGSIYFLGTEKHHQKYLADIADGRL